MCRLFARTAILQLSMIVLSVIACGCKEEIASGLDEMQVRRVVTALGDAGIGADRDKQADNRWRLSVEKEAVPRAMKVIEQQRLIGGVPTAAKENSLFLSDTEQQLQYEQERALTVENTLRNLEGVYDAKVLLHLPIDMPALFKGTKSEGSAGVLLITNAATSISDVEVRQLVAGAVGIPAEKISVLIKKGSPPPEAPVMTPQNKDVPYLFGISCTLVGMVLLITALIRRKFPHVQILSR